MFYRPRLVGYFIVACIVFWCYILCYYTVIDHHQWHNNLFLIIIIIPSTRWLPVKLFLSLAVLQTFGPGSYIYYNMTTSPPHGDNSDNNFPSSETPEEGPEVGASLSGESGSLATPGNGDDSLEEEMPLNFSWVIVDLLCACGLPGTVANLRYLKNQGVTCIVSLTPEHHLPQHDMEGNQYFGVFTTTSNPHHYCHHCFLS